MNRLDLELPVQQFQILRLCAMFVFNLIRSRRYVEAAPGRGQGAQSWTRIGSIHGLDWIGLGRNLEVIAWIGLDWV